MGQLNIEKLKVRQSNGQLLDSDHAMLGLIDFARLNLDQLLDPRNTQALLNKLEGEHPITFPTRFFNIRSQNKHLRIRFDVRPGLR